MTMRIVSFLPSATEMIYALGLGDQLVGITHECDHPLEAKTKPVVVQSVIDTKRLSAQQIDEAVSGTLKAGQSLYAVNEEILTALAPDLVLTQDLCQVCAPSGNEIGALLRVLPHPPQILCLTPTSLSDIFDNLKQIGEATGTVAGAAALIQRLQERVDAVSSRSRALKAPRVFCMEWLSPPYNAGHWMAEMVELAGGADRLARKGEDSVRLAWEAISAEAPEVLILSPCGFNLAETIRQAALLTTYPGWERLPAVERGSVYAVDANSYFARPGPRVVDGIELLAHLIHPDVFAWPGPPDAYHRLSREELKRLSEKRSLSE
jgi:iron complex transport system substrate-binding protein